jgi:hypothetical protein
MNPVKRLNISSATLLIFAVVAATSAVGQERQKVSIQSAAANTKYTQQLFLEVGDVKGHQVRAFEIHRTYPTNAPMINGLKLTEWWTRGISDYVDNNGPAVTYGVFTMENGDKFFVRSNLVAQGSGSSLSATTSGTVTGGTGKFAGMRGILHTLNKADPKAGLNEAQSEIEYWFDK